MEIIKDIVYSVGSGRLFEERDHAKIKRILDILMNEYGFRQETVLHYLQITAEQLEELKNGCPKENGQLLEKEKISYLYDRIYLLYEGTLSRDSDEEVSAFLDVLLNQHDVPADTIAKMAEVDKKLVEQMQIRNFHNPELTAEVKYRMAAVVMRLRYLFCECEK